MSWLDWLRVASEICAYTRMVWWLSAACLMLIKQVMPEKLLRACKFIFHEFKPFYWPSVVVSVISHGAKGTPAWITAAMIGINWFNWWVFRNADNDDDRWKRRKKKLTEAVKQVGGKLIVVQPAASRA